MRGLDRISHRAILIDAIVVLLFIVLVAAYEITDVFTAEEAVAFGTLFLALVTALTVYHSQKQTEVMQKELEFMRRPQILIHHEEVTDQKTTIDDAGWIVFENTGQVPEEITIHLSLAPAEDTDPGSPILNDNALGK